MMKRRTFIGMLSSLLVPAGCLAKKSSKAYFTSDPDTITIIEAITKREGITLEEWEENARLLAESASRTVRNIQLDALNRAGYR